MYCSKCGKQNESDAKFCDDCGSIMVNEVNISSEVSQAPQVRQLKIRKSHLAIAFGILAVIVITAIAVNMSGNRLVGGRWYFEDELAFEFFSDGSVIMPDRRGVPQRHTWSSSNGRLMLAGGFGQDHVIFDYSVSRTTLTLANREELGPEGVTFRRVR